MNLILILKFIFFSPQSPRNLALNNKAKAAETILQNKPATKKRNATNSSISEEIVESATETQIRSAKSDSLKQILDDINSKIFSSSQQP